jgi:hypothetical protein
MFKVSTRKYMKEAMTMLFVLVLTPRRLVGRCHCSEKKVSPSLTLLFSLEDDDNTFLRNTYEPRRCQNHEEHHHDPHIKGNLFLLKNTAWKRWMLPSRPHNPCVYVCLRECGGHSEHEPKQRDQLEPCAREVRNGVGTAAVCTYRTSHHEHEWTQHIFELGYRYRNTCWRGNRPRYEAGVETTAHNAPPFSLFTSYCDVAQDRINFASSGCIFTVPTH